MNFKLLVNHVEMVSGDGRREDCFIECRRGSPVEMIATSRLFGRMAVEATDLFDALCEVRLKAEEHGFLLLCGGARRDAYPSRMSRQMRGQKIYVLSHGSQASKGSMIGLLEPAEYVQVTTVAKQRENFYKWLDSLDGNSSGQMS